MDVDVREQAGFVMRLVKAVVYMSLGSLVAQRAWAYSSPPMESSYPMPAMVMCACLIAVLYTLGVLTLAGRSELRTSSSFDGRVDSTLPPTADRATA